MSAAGPEPGELTGIARLTFHEGRREEFERLAAQCLEIIRTKDTGTLQYEIHLDEDGSGCVFVERYRSSDALIEHNENGGETLQAMLATGSITAELLGEPSARLRALVAGAPVRFHTLFGRS